MAFYKNRAVVGFTFSLVNRTTGAAVTSGTPVGYVTLDGGTQTAIAGTPVHEGNGQWSVNLLAAETNGDIVGLLFTHASAISRQFTIKTTTPPSDTVSDDDDTDFAAIAATPAMVKTDEGFIKERSVEEAILADQYEAAKEVSLPPWGMRIARTKPFGTV